MRRRAVKPARHSRGAVLLEATACIQLLALLVFGIVDLGFAYRDYLTQVGAAKTAARVISNAGKRADADYAGVTALRASIASLPATTLDRVVVFKADADGNPTDPRCLQTGSWQGDHGITGACNIYSGTEVFTATAAQFTPAGASTCVLGVALDARWCPTTRVAPNSTFLTGDSVGVFIQVNFVSRTRMFSISNITIKDRYVMRVEPEVL